MPQLSSPWTVVAQLPVPPMQHGTGLHRPCDFAIDQAAGGSAQHQPSISPASAFPCHGRCLPVSLQQAGWSQHKFHHSLTRLGQLLLLRSGGVQANPVIQAQLQGPPFTSNALGEAIPSTSRQAAGFCCSMCPAADCLQVSRHHEKRSGNRHWLAPVLKASDALYRLPEHIQAVDGSSVLSTKCLLNNIEHLTGWQVIAWF